MIYVDASRFNNTERRTGVENYSFFLISQLAARHPHEITLLSPRKIPLEVAQKVMPFPRLWTQIRLSLFFLGKREETLFVPSHVLPLIHPKKSILTIHDVAFKRYPQSYGLLSRLYLDFSVRFAVRRAWKIITPSKATKKDLVKFYQAPEEKIEVIPLGFKAPQIPVAESGDILDKYGLSEKKYFIYLGRIEHKKNIDGLVRAFSIFAEKHPDISLALSGFAGRGGSGVMEDVPETVRKRIVLTGYLTEEEKAVLMKNALCFVFPSRYEGFGLPLLEAMHYGLPILASDIPSSREILNGDALFFNVEKPEELAERMATAMIQEERGRLTVHHTEKLAKYSWKACAEAVWQLLA